MLLKRSEEKPFRCPCCCSPWAASAELRRRMATRLLRHLHHLASAQNDFFHGFSIGLGLTFEMPHSSCWCASASTVKDASPHCQQAHRPLY